MLQSGNEAQGLENNAYMIDDVALVFEGGGMRASYSSALANLFLENNIHFKHVYGVSAGASNTVNYISQDIWRTKASFTSFAADPEFGGVDTFLQRKGLFNAHYIYEESGRPGCRLEFNYPAFMDSDTNATIAGFERDTGKTVYWTRDDLNTLSKLMVRVRASSSLPIAMPPTMVEGAAYYDGGLGEGSGIVVPRALADGFEKIVMVCTRPKGYRKSEKKSGLVDKLLWRRPHVREALATRGARYNEQLDNLEKLEQSGQAYIFYADQQKVESSEKNVDLLEENYANGYAQARRELESIASFLGI